MPAVDGGRVVLTDDRGSRLFSASWFRSQAPPRERKPISDGRVDSHHAVRLDLWRVAGPRPALMLVPGEERERSLKWKLLKDEIVAASVGKEAATLSRRQAAKILSKRGRR